MNIHAEHTHNGSEQTYILRMVVVTVNRIIKSVVTRQVPGILELRNNAWKRNTNNAEVVHAYITRMDILYQAHACCFYPF